MVPPDKLFKLLTIVTERLVADKLALINLHPPEMVMLFTVVLILQVKVALLQITTSSVAVGKVMGLIKEPQPTVVQVVKAFQFPDTLA